LKDFFRVRFAAFIFLGAIAMLLPQNAGAEGRALPEPSYSSDVSIEEALERRRSVRGYGEEPVTLEEASQLLWAAQGVTSLRGFRTAPSAGALYPLEVYLVAGKVTDLEKGVYKYRPKGHALVKVAEDDLRSELASAALGQRSVQAGAIVLVFSAVYERTTSKYGRRGIQYTHMEVGHAAQNVYLQAQSLELGTVFIGAFKDDRVKGLLQMPDKEHPLGIMPVGKTR
jgi:SagB-type dehydrogenase family enzyme